MKRIFSLCVVLLFFVSLSLSGQTLDKSPEHKTIIPNIPSANPNATFDVQFNYDLTTVTNLGNAGAEYDGKYLWVAKWSTNKWFRLNVNGTIRDSFVVANFPGASNCRDLAFDGKYIYGGVATGNTICKIDTGTLSVVKTINTSVASIRAIAWDPGLKGFWVCGWGDAIVCVDTNGTLIPGKSITNSYQGKYGLAYDGISPGGPFLWVFDQTTATGGSGQYIYKFDLNTLTYTGVSLDVTTKITNAGSAAVAGGLFVGINIVPGYATIGGILQGTPDRLFGLELAVTDAGPLQPFNLQSPAAGTTITSIPGSSSTVSFNWDTSRAAATYKLIFGTALPTRLITIPVGTNIWTVTLGQLDQILAAAGLNQGDSVSGAWDVWAFRNNAPLNDSLKSTNGPRALKLKRIKPSLTAFNLINPPNNSRIETLPGGAANINFSWSHSGAGTTYKLYYASPNFNSSSNIKFCLVAGVDTNILKTTGDLDAIISSFVAAGDSTVGQWRVYAYSGTDSLVSSQTYNITLRRLPIGNIIIGTGSVALSYPFTTFWMAGRTQMVYTKSEILAAGGHGSITAIGFNVISAAPQVMNGFTVRMAKYADSILTGGFVEDAPWVTVYSGTYTVAGTGWQNINLTTPFAYDPAKNLLIEVCYTNSSYTTSSTVAGTSGTVEQFQYNRHMDNTVGCTMTSSAGSNYTGGRPNIKLVMNLITNENSEVGIIPSTYSLSQNYPNPFNPVTKINFAIPKQGFTTLKVYDLLGREVTRLVNEMKTPGNYSIDFDATALSSGVYFYKLEVNGFSDVKRMVLIK